MSAQKWCVQSWEAEAPKREQAWCLLKCKLDVQDNKKDLFLGRKFLRQGEANLSYTMSGNTSRES